MCLCVLLHLPPPRCCFLCVCAREKEIFFFFFYFSSPGSVWHWGSDHVKSERGRDGQMDGRSVRELGEPATIATRLGGGSSERRRGRVMGGVEVAAVLTSQK